MQALRGPVKIESTRVRRLYTGGALLEAFRGTGFAGDGFLPEDWVGSTTAAVNRNPIAGEGISRVIIGGDSVSLATVMADPIQRRTLFGAGRLEACTPGVLVKLLDAQVTLALQTHPDRELMRRQFGDNHGKCESWVVLGGRTIAQEAPHVYFGFCDKVTRDDFERAYFAQDSQAMKAMMNRVPVRPGDTFFIPPNCIHAIGAGTFLLEIQEPTDYVFQFEREGSCWHLNDYEVHMGLGDRTMLDSVDFGFAGRKLLDTHMGHVDLLSAREPVTPLFTSAQRTYFNGEVISVGGKLGSTLVRSIPEQYGVLPARIGIVYNGFAEIEANGIKLPLHHGESYLIPAGTETIVYRQLGDDDGFCAVMIEAYATISGT